MRATLRNRLYGAMLDRLLRLPPAVTRDIRVTEGIRIGMLDGVDLVADLYQPNVPDAPTVLARTPYGRVGMVSRALAIPYAQRGFNVLIQSVRGSHGGSGGVFDPFRHEEADGLATLDWIEKQSWYHGQLFLAGPSYLGYTQWALAIGADDRVSGLLPAVALSDARELLYAGGGFFTGLAVQWIHRMTLLERSAHLADAVEVIGDRRALRAMWTLPLTDADRAATGKHVDYYQRWLTTPADAPYWSDRRVHDRLGRITAPTHIFGCWYDFCLPQQIADYRAMRAAGRDPLLTIGPWAHVDTEMMAAAVREGLTWFGRLARGEQPERKRVRLFVGGIEQWREFDAYPPGFVLGQQWYLHPSAGLAPTEPDTAATRHFRYDPADPTPDIGGATLDGGRSGRKDQREREYRPDVLTYTGAPLESDYEIIGPVRADITLRTSASSAGLFVRLCDVDPTDRSTNVCDGYLHATGLGDGPHTVTVDLWPTAYRFRAGHRPRLQISGGSFPRFARNTGSGESPLTAVTLTPVDYEIHTGSTITLPANAYAHRADP